MDMAPRKKIFMFLPFMPDSVPDKVAETLRGRWIGQGPKVDEFEREFERNLGVENAVFLNNATGGLRLALAVAGIGPGDEVITPALTCTATNSPILEQFAKPVFADIQYETINLNPDDIEHRITGKTKAIICVHWGGYPCDLDDIHKIARSHGLKVIEDASHAIKASYKGRPIGSISDFTVFSMGAIKQITTADGGMLTAKKKEDYEAAMRRRWYGIDKKGRKPTPLGHDPTYDIWELGYKYSPTDIGAVMGIEGLKHLDSVLKRRAEISRMYRDGLSDAKDVTLLDMKDDRKSSDWLFTIHVKDRLKFAETMVSKGIEVSVPHWRNDQYTLFGPKRNDLPNTDKANETMICIPLHYSLSDDDVSYVIDTIRKGW
jgi:perosamine synthetase